MKFYRYEAVEYASIGHDGECTSSKIPNPKIELREFNLFRETDKGYWIGYGSISEGAIRSQANWVSKNAIKRYAYPSKKEAMDNFIKRTQRRIKILKRTLWSCEIQLSLINKEV